MRDMILVLEKFPGLGLLARTIPNKLEEFQSIVEGNIEVIQVRKNVLIICNEESKVLASLAHKKNFDLTVGGEVVDTIYGPAIFCSQDGEDFDDLETSSFVDIYDSMDPEHPCLEVTFA